MGKRRPPSAAEVAALRELVGPEVDQQLRAAGQEGLTDAYLARWLVARKGSPTAAKAAILNEAEWRSQLAAKGPITEARNSNGFSSLWACTLLSHPGYKGDVSRLDCGGAP